MNRDLLRFASASSGANAYSPIEAGGWLAGNGVRWGWREAPRARREGRVFGSAAPAEHLKAE